VSLLLLSVFEELFEELFELFDELPLLGVAAKAAVPVMSGIAKLTKAKRLTKNAVMLRLLRLS